MKMENIDSYAGHTQEWYDKRTEYLSQFMLPERFECLSRVVSQRTKYMTICAENTFHPQNASALVRNSEAFGVQQIHTVESQCKFQPNLNIVRGTDKWVDLISHTSTQDAVAWLKSNGYRIVATTPHRDDRTPETFDVEAGKFCLVFGTEKEGISPEIIEAADEFLMIPMCGFVESLNVSACAAILLQTLSSRVRSSDVEWQLTPLEQSQLLFEWMMESLRDSQKILDKFVE